MINIPFYRDVRYNVRDVVYVQGTLQTKGLGRLDLDVMYRILSVLSDNSTIGITNLQMRSGINHSTCAKYLKALERLELITLIVGGKNKTVGITQKGRDLCALLS